MHAQTIDDGQWDIKKAHLEHIVFRCTYKKDFNSKIDQ